MRKCFSWMVTNILFIGMLTITGCHFPQTVIEPTPTAVSQTITPWQPTHSKVTMTPTSTATLTYTPSTTPNPPNPTSSQTPTPTWVYNEPGQVIAPILLYHHVNGENTDSRYRVSIPDFRAQMQTLYEEGYTTITISMLVEALTKGRDLPPKPVVITFDDGHQSVYENAFPVMSEFGFVGVFYIVANRIYDIDDFVNITDLKTMIAAGWEIGSHGYTHSDITQNHGSAAYEIAQSKHDLERAIGSDVNTFAYPFGTFDTFVGQKVSNYGYLAGMGLGKSTTHTLGNLFYLNRIEIHGDTSLDEFYNKIHLE